MLRMLYAMRQSRVQIVVHTQKSRLLLKSDTAIQRYSDTGTGTWNRNLESCTTGDIHDNNLQGGGGRGDAIQR